MITNGSLLHRPNVQSAIRHIGLLGGEVWFKIDRAMDAEVAEINGIPGDLAKVLKNLRSCAALAPTWVQTCWFKLDGNTPSAESRDAYCDLLREVADKLAGVHLYGLARPSQQPAATRLSAVSTDELVALGQQIEKTTGIRVIVSP